MVQWSVLFRPSSTLGRRYPALRGNLMATMAISTSRVYPTTLLYLIAEKRKTAHARFIESAMRDLKHIYYIEISRKPIRYYLS